MAEYQVARKSPAGSSGGPEGLFGPAVYLLLAPPCGSEFGTVPAGVHRTAFCKQLGSMARLKAPLSAFGLDGAATNFFGRKNSYLLVRFVLAGPGRRWDTAARKPNHSVEWLAVPLFSNTLFFLALGSPPRERHVEHHWSVPCRRICAVCFKGRGKNTTQYRYKA